MNILLLAPHPFYQERGTPIAVNLLLRALSTAGHTVDVLTYHEGEDVSYPRVTIHRIRRPPFARQVPPGPSLKKILCDLYLFPKALAMARRKRYDIVHAVEESVYMAMWLRRRRGLPYLYDMDSSLSLQVADKFPRFRFLLPAMRHTEGAAVRKALAVVPVCDALADIARRDGARKVFLLRDVSLLNPAEAADEEVVLRLMPPRSAVRFLYIGNLESYQGIDLQLESFKVFLTRGGLGQLVLAGGKAADIQRYRDKATALGLAGQVHFIGPQPVSRMAALFNAADILVSPRVKGNNTPMKIYSYLASGKAILATDLPTHTQVLTPEFALLAPPSAELFGEAMVRLAADPSLRAKLGATGRTQAARLYSVEAFDRAVREIYDWVGTEIVQGRNGRVP